MLLKPIVTASLLLLFAWALHAQYREIPLPFPDTTRFKVQFVDEMHGWVSSWSGIILRTTDGGISWDSIRSPYGNRIDEIQFSNKDYGVLWIDASGGIAQGRLYHTFDGGQTWERVFHPDSIYIDFNFHVSGLWSAARYGTKFSLGTVATNHISYYGGRVWRVNGGPLQSQIYYAGTTNGGVTWSYHSQIEVRNTHTIFSLLDTLTWAIFDVGADIPDIVPKSYFRKSTDFGNIWRITKIWDYTAGTHGEFTDALRGIFFLENGGAYITVDGGETWEGWLTAPGFTGQLLSDSILYFLDWSYSSQNIDWHQPAHGKLRRITRFAGTKGYSGQIIIPFPLYSINSVKEIVYALSTEGRLFKIDDKLVSVSDESSSSPQPIQCNVFPNPFGSATKSGNQITTINFTLPKAQHVRLSVIDLLGREVAVLVNEEETDGNHVVEFNGDGLPSGVYQLVLMAGEKVVTLKMNLVK